MEMPGVFIAPGVDPTKAPGVAAYQAGVMARRGGALPKADMPLNPPRPPVPLLSGGPSRPGQTMAEAAAFERGAEQHAAQWTSTEQGARSIVEPDVSGPQPLKLAIYPTDLLPKEARQDPEYRSGQGSDVAVNQPNLAAKYGVLRKGAFIPPQKLTGSHDPQQRQLRPETVKDLEDLRRLQQGQGVSGLDQDDVEARKAVAGGIGGSAGRAAGASVDPTPEVSEDERAKLLKDAIDRMDAFEFSQWRQLMMRKVIASEDERELIESRLQPLDLAELLLKGVIRQRIPIIPGKYELTLQSYEGQVELGLKRLLMLESRSVNVGDQYLLDKHMFMSLAVGLHKVNDMVFPDIVNQDGVFDDELFLAKFNKVMRLPMHMLASIGVNQMWFEMRVRKLYSATAVGNG